MEKTNIVYTVCLNEKNIHTLIDIIKDNIKLSDRSTPKIIMMINEIMKNNIRRLDRLPRNKGELRDVVEYLNKLCLDEIVTYIAKKYPDLYIQRKRQVSKEQMRRDLDVYGRRDNYVPDRPVSSARRDHIDDETFYGGRPNDIGLSGAEEDNNGGYASAWGNHMITNVPLGQKQQFLQERPEQKDGSAIEQRFQQMINTRDAMQSTQAQQQRQPIDFTIYATENKRRVEPDQSYMSNGNVPMGNVPMGNVPMGNVPMGVGASDDPYASLLGAGAPAQMGQMGMGQMGMGQMGMGQMGMGQMGMGQMGMGQMGMGQMGMGQMGMGQMGMGQMGMGQMGMSNSLMPVSSTSMLADQMGSFGNNNQTVKATQLSNDFERKLLERRMIDMETSQPQQHGYQQNQFSMSQPNQFSMSQPNQTQSMFFN